MLQSSFSATENKTGINRKLDLVFIHLFCSGFLTTWALEEIHLKTAAKDALDGDILDELMPISELLRRLTKCRLEVLQQDWDARHHKKLHKIDVNSETERLFFLSLY